MQRASSPRPSWWLRALRVLPAVLAAFELRSTLRSATSAGLASYGLEVSGSPSIGFWLIVALSAGAGVLLWKARRGLRQSGRPAPRTGPGFIWAALLLGLFLASDLVGGSAAQAQSGGLAHLLGPLGWSSIAAAGAVGWLLATFLQSARRVLRAVVRWYRARRRPSSGASVRRFRGARSRRLWSATLLRGRFSRGPPCGAVTAAAAAAAG